MTSISPVDCDGCVEKPVIPCNVRETAEYQETMNHPDSDRLMRTLAELAELGKQHILPALRKL